jgi:hypothetical protein
MDSADLHAGGRRFDPVTAHWLLNRPFGPWRFRAVEGVRRSGPAAARSRAAARADRALGVAPVRVLGSDPYRLDGDGDGLGCE